MDHIDRYSALVKMAKKELDIPTLRGKVSKKDIEKHLAKVKKIYEESKTQYKDAKKKAEELATIVQSSGDAFRNSRIEMEKIYKVIQNLDISTATEVKFDKSGKDVFYMKGGKLYTVDEDGELVSYKRTKPTGEEFTEE